jgi:hypothetical protein
LKLPTKFISLLSKARECFRRQRPAHNTEDLRALFLLKYGVKEAGEVLLNACRENRPSAVKDVFELSKIDPDIKVDLCLGLSLAAKYDAVDVLRDSTELFSSMRPREKVVTLARVLNYQKEVFVELITRSFLSPEELEKARASYGIDVLLNDVRNCRAYILSNLAEWVTLDKKKEKDFLKERMFHLVEKIDHLVCGSHQC